MIWIFSIIGLLLLGIIAMVYVRLQKQLVLLRGAYDSRWAAKSTRLNSILDKHPLPAVQSHPLPGGKAPSLYGESRMPYLDLPSTEQTQEERLARGLEIATKTQAFFEKLRLDSKAPHYGDFAKKFIDNMLLRAQEQGIFVP